MRAAYLSEQRQLFSRILRSTRRMAIPRCSSRRSARATTSATPTWRS